MRRFNDLVDQVRQIVGSEEPYDDPADDLLSDEAVEDHKRRVIAAAASSFAIESVRGRISPLFSAGYAWILGILTLGSE